MGLIDFFQSIHPLCCPKRDYIVLHWCNYVGAPNGAAVVGNVKNEELKEHLITLNLRFIHHMIGICLLNNICYRLIRLRNVWNRRTVSTND